MKSKQLGLERPPDPDTTGNRCAKPDPRYPTRLSAKVLISRCAIFFMSSAVFRVPSSENCLLINRLATTRDIPLNKAENIEEFIQPASGTPNPDPVLISVYVSDTRPDTDFLCSFHPYKSSMVGEI